MNRFLRLVLVEMRKSVDTRGARWAFSIAIVLGALLGYIVPGGAGAEFAPTVGATSIVIPLLMPLLAVMTVTADWTTRTALTMLPAVPRRSLLLGARYTSVLALATITLVAIHAVSAVAYLTIRPGAAATILDGAVVAQFGSMLGTTIAATLTAIAVAGIVLRVVPALLIATLVPFGILVGASFWPTVAGWVNPYGFATWISAPQWNWIGDSEHVGVLQAAVSLGAWTVLPLFVGWYRQLRVEPR